ncbi:hypothetical protein [Prevotella dentasini]|uniref:hypothetical protein n=1 Tax=Prevotella dentasini TaxID=589537 RepID=UPI0004692B62|nr:hypothetical protein [Prevotella dentasini]
MARSKSRRHSAERISQWVLYIIVALSGLVFTTFYLVDFDLPFSGNGAFNAPLLTDLLLGFMFVLFLTAIGVMVYSLLHTFRKAGRSEGVVNGIPARKVSYSVFGATLLCLVLTFALGSSSGMLVNGVEYNDVIWLRISDMFVWSSLILLVLATLSVIFGATRYYRKGRRRR